MNLPQTVKHQLHDLENICNHSEPPFDMEEEYGYETEDIQTIHTSMTRSQRSLHKLFDDPEDLL